VIANRELIEQVRVQYRSLARAEFHYVAGHANVMGNEVANFLAQRATRPAQRAK
jgi:ribonuclease HI